MFIKNATFNIRKNTRIQLSLIFRKRQIRYVRLRLHLVRKTRIHTVFLNRIIRRKKRQYAREMGIRRLTYHLRGSRIWVTRREVHESLKVVDAEGLQARKGRKLVRRIFHSRGRDEVWSLDGHDKLKRWGFLIHGCNDVYSRYLIWLRVGLSNNDPRFVLSHYLSAIEEIAESCSSPNRLHLPFSY